MSSMKEDRDESDGDEMEHDTAESDKSSTTSDSSDASDSDDSSELDIEECERRRNECLEYLAELERQFITLREQLYRERITQIKSKLEEVQEGSAKEYRMPLEDLENNMKTRIEVAGILKKLRAKSIEIKFKAEEQAALQDFENEKRLLFDTMKEELEDRIRRLEEDRNNVDLGPDSYTSDRRSRGGGGRGGVHGRKGGGRGGAEGGGGGRRKPIPVTGPYIVYMLTEEEILEDWTIIKKALAKANSDRRLSKSFSRPSLSRGSW